MVSAEDTEPAAETFESMNVGDMPTGWTTGINSGTPTIGVQQESDNKFLRMDVTNGANAWIASPDIAITSSRYEMAFRFRTSTAKNSANIWLVKNTNDANLSEGMIQGSIDGGTGKFQIRDNKANKATSKVPSDNTRHTFKWTIDAETKMF